MLMNCEDSRDRISFGPLLAGYLQVIDTYRSRFDSDENFRQHLAEI